MKRLLPLLTMLCASLIPAAAAAKDFVLIDAGSNKNQTDWSISGTDAGLAGTANVSIAMRTLHGGKQEGVQVIDVNNGRLAFTVVPTRGMNIERVQSGDITLGWSSPVKEIVNPAFITLDSRAGLGWLDGFNEWLVRCGYEWAGHPGMDNGKLLTLHGRIGNTPASQVVVVIDEAPPYRLHVRGRVDEKVFKFTDYEVWTDVSTEPGSDSLRIADTLTNNSDYEREYQVLYHGNFGPPLLEEGSEFVAPVKRVAPFNDAAAKDIKTWTTYLGPTKGFGEQVFNVVPFADASGTTAVMLRNKAGDKGIRVSYGTASLPYFTLWKNTDTLREGYVTGLEPGSGYAYPRPIERTFGRVPKLAPGATQSFALDYTILHDKESVAKVARDIAAIAAGRSAEVISKPEAKE